MKLALSKAWNCQDIRISGPQGLYFPFVHSSSKKKRIMETGPWSFDNQLVIMKDWARGEDPLTIPFDNCIFWIQVRGLKPEFFTWEMANKLGEAFPRCEDVELRREKGGSRFFRIKSGVNVLQPLRRFLQFHVEEKVSVGYLDYERLPNLCLKYGLLGHLIRQCTQFGEGVDPHNWEKSWIIFRINDEPQDCLPRKLQVSQPKHYSLTQGIGEISKTDKVVIPITDEQNTATIKHCNVWSQQLLSWKGGSKSQLCYSFSRVNGEQSPPSVPPGFSKRINEEARNAELNQKEDLSDVNASMD
ncbi:hypothetical protein LIER_17691 [Lithospermum erythrorhizon]